MNSPSSQRPRSAIEAMVDAATGFNPMAHVPPPESNDLVTEALLEVADAAKAWQRDHVRGTKRLNAAVKRWKELGG